MRIFVGYRYKRISDNEAQEGEIWIITPWMKIEIAVPKEIGFVFSVFFPDGILLNV